MTRKLPIFGIKLEKDFKVTMVDTTNRNQKIEQYQAN